MILFWQTIFNWKRNHCHSPSVGSVAVLTTATQNIAIKHFVSHIRLPVPYRKIWCSDMKNHWYAKIWCNIQLKHNLEHHFVSNPANKQTITESSGRPFQLEQTALLKSQTRWLANITLKLREDYITSWRTLAMHTTSWKIYKERNCSTDSNKHICVLRS